MDIDTIAKLARLAALQVAAAETERLCAELGRIVAFVDAIQAADTVGVAPLAHPLDGVQPLRPDRVTEVVRREQLQAGAPLVRDGLYLVPRVIE